jgi:DNA-binding transcriptional MerR regulator
MTREGELLKIGELAKLAGVLPSTVHFYTQQGLLKFADETRGGYRLYARASALSKIKQIRSLQSARRLTIAEIKKKFKKL